MKISRRSSFAACGDETRIRKVSVAENHFRQFARRADERPGAGLRRFVLTAELQIERLRFRREQMRPEQRTEFLPENIVDPLVEPVLAGRPEVADPRITSFPELVKEVADPLRHVEIDVVHFGNPIAGIGRNERNMFFLQHIGNLVSQRGEDENHAVDRQRRQISRILPELLRPDVDQNRVKPRPRRFSVDLRRNLGYRVR